MFPAEALAQVTSRGYRVALATDYRGKRYEPFAGGIPTYVLNSGTIGSGLVKKIKSVFSLGMGFLQARKLLSDLKPSVVVGFGGYPSIPAMYAAQYMKIPTVIHEQNAVLGRANVFLAPKAERIAVAWARNEGLESRDEARAIVRGIPCVPKFPASTTNRSRPSNKTALCAFSSPSRLPRRGGVQRNHPERAGASA